jgi:GT2 family glycosyltransferase
LVIVTGGRLGAPAQVLDLDLDDLADEGNLRAATSHRSAWCLVRASGVPIEVVTWDEDTDARALLEAVRHRPVATRGPLQAAATTDGPRPGLTVVICTRGRAHGLGRALAALSAQTDPDFDVLVVDNAPEEDVETRAVVDGAPLARCRYVHEPTPGLSHARNRGLAEVRTELLAWLDDDELADGALVHWVRQGFAHPSRPDAVCGVMLPAELATEAQVRFEQYGGFNKGRGLDPVVLRVGTDTVRSSLYPIPNFGAGGNMAFKTAALHAVGGFDPLLGAGTLTHGGEETKVLANLLRAGSAVLHWPPAITWHYHRRTMEELEKQFFGYAAGLPAFYMSMLRSSPSAAWDILGLVPRGMADILSQRGRGRAGDLPEDFPPALLQASRRGLLQGASLYVREARRQRRRARSRRREVSGPATH